jgi:dTDP-4-dehydrorhamnose reductase
VVNDQWGAPTRAALIADVTAHILRQPQPQPGTYHVAANGATNWHDYAVLAVAHARDCGMPLKASPETITAIASSQYPQAAARPRNSRLDTSRLRATFGVNLPPWQDGVRAVVAELAALSAKI